MFSLTLNFHFFSMLDFTRCEFYLNWLKKKKSSEAESCLEGVRNQREAEGDGAESAGEGWAQQIRKVAIRI